MTKRHNQRSSKLTLRKSQETLPNGFHHCTIAAHIANLACNSTGVHPDGTVFEDPDVYDSLLERVPSLHPAINKAGENLDMLELHDYENIVERYSMETFSNLSEEDAEHLHVVMLEIVAAELAKQQK